MAQVMKSNMKPPTRADHPPPGPAMYMGPGAPMGPPHPYAAHHYPSPPMQAAPVVPHMQPVQQQPMMPHPTAVSTGNGVAPASNTVANGEQGHIIEDNDMTENLANTKEKTPMCLINELARFNKITHQYTLTDESGPAHKKVFYVKLKLGEEEYAASGASIKKAQHAAADSALETTQYKHPPPKPMRRPNGNMSAAAVPDSLTPTVLLNAMVMRRGEPAVYHHIEMLRSNYNRPANLDFRGMYNQRYHYPRYPRVFYVSLKVGQREFIGMGNSRQAARHDAASKALQVLQSLPMPTEADRLQMAAQAQAGEEQGDDEDEDALKSEISLVFEIALKRNYTVSFEVIRESGPPHMRTFVTRCTVDRFQTEAEGNSKKISKKRAAEKMLAELQALPSIQPTVIKPKRMLPQKKKKRNLIKAAGGEASTGEQLLPRTDPNYGIGINPISRLIQIQQAKKEKEPAYSLVAERGMPRRREFVMQVQVGDKTCTGVGPNKKLAKRNAAEAMLQLLGYSRPSPQPGKPAIKTAESPVPTAGGDKKVTFIDQEGNNSRQLVPGVLLMPDGARTHGAYSSFANSQGNLRPGMQQQPVMHFSAHTMATIARELLETGMSMTAEALYKGDRKPAMGQPARPKHHLFYLAEIMALQVQFTDFPKGNTKNEYLSLVSLSTNPPHVSHGAGSTIDDSHDMAALTALRALAEMSLEKKPDIMAAGDGSHMGADKRANSDMNHCMKPEV